MTRTARLRAAAALLAAVLWGCAGLELAPEERAPTRATAAAALVEGVWTARPAVLLLRQTALLEAQGTKVAADGLMRLDTAAGSARLVAVNEMGLKLFDVTATRAGVTENFLLPELARAPGLSASVAASLRAVFLDRQPRATDRLTIGPDRYVLTRQEGDGTLTCTFGGNETLIHKDYAAESESWTVRFSQYRVDEGLLVPGTTVFTDRRAGYRLTLWLKEVKRAHE